MSDRPALEPPPVAFVDEEGRTIRIERSEGDRDALVTMYEDFAPEDRAQGLPPVGRERIEKWLETIEEGIHVVAWHDDQAVGHAALLAGEDDHELMIFVHQDYQLAGIGSRLIRALLGAGRRDGAENVWLCVRPSNAIAISLYRSVGFEAVGSGETELEMSLSFDDEGSDGQSWA
ncbi:GNAT family N-acetyltransferase [Halorhabdus amylolytica]|uniref:GNAT family N-acetyltransferase n=1 Tax=Halorhabdus amylolytica TaxID=2559573 RepID=UPI0010A9D903|nr:GNAT family N-acetyltransferase [Halorhabdus amylolytica]